MGFKVILSIDRGCKKSMMNIRVTPVARVLLIACVGLYLIQMTADTFFGAHLFEWLGLVPYRVFNHFALWQLLTYQFMHGDMFHLLFNMLVLWMVGSELESTWGSRFFTRYYFLCGTTGGLIYLAAQVFVSDPMARLIPVVGSSGAIYGLLVAYGILFSERTMLFMMIFPMKAKHFVMLLAGVELFTTVFGSRTGVANLAHLGGMLAGFLALSLIAHRRAQARLGGKVKNIKTKKKRPSSSHLRLVINNELLKEFDRGDDDDDAHGSRGPIH